MTPHNYFRAALPNLLMQTKFLRETAPKGLYGKVCETVTSSSDVIKFVLPDDAQVLDGLTGNSLVGEPPRLPFPKCMLELRLGGWPTVVMAMQGPSGAGFDVVVLTRMQSPRGLIWIVGPVAARVHPDPVKENDGAGSALVSLLWIDDKRDWADVVEHLEAEARAAACSVMTLIEALSCSNVDAQVLPVRKLNKSAAARGALPFDEYKVLVVRPRSVDGAGRRESSADRRSPRQHLRRGHVRRYQSGLKVWINSMVVAAQPCDPGPRGRITKDYVL